MSYCFVLVLVFESIGDNKLCSWQVLVIWLVFELIASSHFVFCLATQVQDIASFHLVRAHSLGGLLESHPSNYSWDAHSQRSQRFSTVEMRLSFCWILGMTIIEYSSIDAKPLTIIEYSVDAKSLIWWLQSIASMQNHWFWRL